MANPLFSLLNGSVGNNQMLGQFMNFMSQMKGANPDEILQTMISSGQINQNQLNAAHKKAEEMSAVFNSVKNNFGF